MAEIKTKKKPADPATPVKRKRRKTTKKVANKAMRPSPVATPKQHPEKSCVQNRSTHVALSQADDAVVAPVASSGTESSAAPSPDGTTSPGAASGGHRVRQASVSVILDQLFGPLAQCDPELWDRRAYLLLVGSAYERMASNDDISTEELGKLAKVLAENRRSKSSIASGTSMKDEETPQTSKNGHLPDRFAEMVRDLYGTAVPTGEAEPMASGVGDDAP